MWEQTKRQAWVDRLVSGRQPVGGLLTYQLVKLGETISPVYLNDGSQRVRTTVEFADAPDKYGYSREEVEHTLDSCQISVQHVHYENHEEALEDFEFLNSGTPCTPFEFCFGILVYMEGYAINWKKLFERLERKISLACARVVSQTDFKREFSVDFHMVRGGLKNFFN